MFYDSVLMKQSWDDMVQALKCNPKNQHAIRIKGQLEYLYGHILKYQGAKF